MGNFLRTQLLLWSIGQHVEGNLANISCYAPISMFLCYEMCATQGKPSDIACLAQGKNLTNI